MVGISVTGICDLRRMALSHISVEEAGGRPPNQQRRASKWMEAPGEQAQATLSVH